MLRLEGVSVEYPVKGGFFKAVDDVSLHIRENETFALVGESGSGKSTLSMSLINLLPGVRRAGAAYYNGQDLFSMPSGALRLMLGREIGMVFQNPYCAFDPVYKIGAQIIEILSVDSGLAARDDKRRRMEELLTSVGLEAGRVQKLSRHELSGGMLQRAQLAAALCRNPSFLIADEPTSALDVTVQAQIVKLLQGLKRNRGLTILIITHDWGVVAALADTAAVMRNGKIVESGPVSEILRQPSHPFTQELLRADLAYR